MLGELKELWKFRELLLTLVQRELKIRYKNSFLGFFWSLLNPLMTVGVMYIVFKFFLPTDMRSLSVYILAAYLPYMFFQLSILDSAQSVLAALPLVRKIYFPREVLPLAAIISNFIHFMLAMLVFFVLLTIVWIFNPQQSPFQVTTLYLPLLLLINFVLVTGLGLIVSALNTFYEDVKYLAAVFLYLLFFLCPIMYFSEMVRYSPTLPYRETLYVVYHMNPIAMLCTAYRKILLAPQPIPINDGQGHVEKVPALPLDWTFLGLTALTSFVILIYGYWLFNRLKWKFVERP